MATHEIAESDWETYFQAFTERHKGALLSIEDVDPMSQPRYEMRDMPFVSIAYKPHATNGPIIELVTSAKDGGSEQQTHAIHAPKGVFHKPGAGVLSSEVNQDEVLEITSGGKPPVYYMTFQHPA